MGVMLWGMVVMAWGMGVMVWGLRFGDQDLGYLAFTCMRVSDFRVLVSLRIQPHVGWPE